MVPIVISRRYRCRSCFAPEIINSTGLVLDITPPFSLVNRHPFGSARSSPRREAAERTLDGEDRSGIIWREGKADIPLVLRSVRFPSLPAGINTDDSDPLGPE